jgi:hypothetical protein
VCSNPAADFTKSLPRNVRKTVAFNKKTPGAIGIQESSARRKAPHGYGELHRPKFCRSVTLLRSPRNAKARKGSAMKTWAVVYRFVGKPHRLRVPLRSPVARGSLDGGAPRAASQNSSTFTEVVLRE